MITSPSSLPRPPVLVNWPAAVEVLHVLGRSAARDAVPILESMARQLLAPLCRLEEISRLAWRVLGGDERAMGELHRLACAARAARPSTDGLFDRFCAQEERPLAADCGCAEATLLSTTARGHALGDSDVLQESSLVRLILAIASAGAASSRIQTMATLNLMVGALIEAGPIVRLARAYRREALAGLLAELRLLAGSGEMGTMMYASGMPDLPFPEDDLQFPDFDPELESPAWPPMLKPVTDIIAELQKPKQWDREYWQPFTPFERDPVMDFPPGWLNLLACLREVSRRLQARAALPPPPRPTRAVWSDGITGVEQSGHCVGDRVVIRGNGFAGLRGTAVLILPFHDGCHPVAVPDADWTDVAITVALPENISSGPIGFADAAYVTAYAAWVEEQNRLLKELKKFSCYPLFDPLDMAAPFRECPPDHTVNRLRAGAAVIMGFTVNGLGEAFVEPGTSLVLDWTVINAESIALERLGADGPGFNGAKLTMNPPGQSYELGPFNGDKQLSEKYTLTAVGPCGQVQATVLVRLCKVPSLRITGVEVTQGIQKFRSPDGGDNSIPIVASKDTVVRVYVTAENLDGFKLDWLTPDAVRISGELRMGAFVFPPLNGLVATAEPDSVTRRSRANATLNFRLPAAVAQGTKTLRVRVWSRDELDSAPNGDKVRPTTPFTNHSTTWHDKVPFRVRYVRVSQPGVPALSDQQARDVVLRAFDLLPTPPLDIAPAWMPMWHTGEDLKTRDGISNLMEHIDDQHDCTTSEALFFWEDSCPSDDGAVWLAVTPRTDWGGMAQGHRWFNTSRNTAVVPPSRITAAHELGHTRKLNHINVGSGFEDDEFDALPNGGAIRAQDAIDPSSVNMLMDGVMDFSGLYDFMSYAPLRWVSPENWKRLFDKF